LTLGFFSDKLQDGSASLTLVEIETMPVSRDDVIRTAQLARLRLKPEELEVMTRELSVIFQYIDQLHEVNTDNVEPLHHVLEMYNVLEEDQPRDCLPREVALREAPDRTPEFFRVPRVID